jgi:hypothetical protein
MNINGLFPELALYALSDRQFHTAMLAWAGSIKDPLSKV